jgi:hypothetical protein
MGALACANYAAPGTAFVSLEGPMLGEEIASKKVAMFLAHHIDVLKKDDSGGNSRL